MMMPAHPSIFVVTLDVCDLHFMCKSVGSHLQLKARHKVIVQAMFRNPKIRVTVRFYLRNLFTITC